MQSTRHHPDAYSWRPNIQGHFSNREGRRKMPHTHVCPYAMINKLQTRDQRERKWRLFSLTCRFSWRALLQDSFYKYRVCHMKSPTSKAIPQPSRVAKPPHRLGGKGGLGEQKRQFGAFHGNTQAHIYLFAVRLKVLHPLSLFVFWVQAERRVMGTNQHFCISLLWSRLRSCLRTMKRSRQLLLPLLVLLCFCGLNLCFWKIGFQAASQHRDLWSCHQCRRKWWARAHSMPKLPNAHCPAASLKLVAMKINRVERDYTWLQDVQKMFPPDDSHWFVQATESFQSYLTQVCLKTWHP